MDSILNSIKKLLGIAEEDNSFDVDIMMHINSVFVTLSQLGIGPRNGFAITDEFTTWDEYFGEGKKNEMVKTYVYRKVQLVFDTPSNSAVLGAMERSINELEWRLNVEAETPSMTTEEG